MDHHPARAEATRHDRSQVRAALEAHSVCAAEVGARGGGTRRIGHSGGGILGPHVKPGSPVGVTLFQSIRMLMSLYVYVYPGPRDEDEAHHNGGPRSGTCRQAVRAQPRRLSFVPHRRGAEGAGARRGALLHRAVEGTVSSRESERSAVRNAGQKVPLMLLDTDILIDVALDRDPHSREAAELLDRLQTRPKRAFVAWHTLSNFHYLVAPRRSGVGLVSTARTARASCLTR